MKALLYIAILVAGIAAPYVFPAYTNQISVLWLMIVFALTWDILGGQMGYNLLGNIFFGAGMYICALFQIGLYYDIGGYMAAYGAIKVEYTHQQYFNGLAIGTIAAGVLSSLLAIIFGWIVFALRGPYFAIGTLGVALVAAGELVTGWDWVGGGGGISLPTLPGGPDTAKQLFYFMNFGLAVATFATLRWLYSTRFWTRHQCHSRR